MTEPRSILLVRLDGLGDALACVPALEGLARAWPQAQFGAVCSSANAPLFSNRVAHRHVADGRRSFDDVIADVAAVGYDWAFVATEEVAGYRIARRSGARRRAGFWHGFEKTFKSLWQFSQLTDRVYRPAAWVGEPEHEVETIYRIALALGALSPAPRDPAALSRWLDIDRRGTTAAPGTPSLGVQVTPKLATGGWGPATLGAMISFASEQSRLGRCVLLTSPDDEVFARAVLEHVALGLRSGGSATLAPPGPMPAWLGALANVSVVITPDTGAAHAAGMLGVPVVDLFEEPQFPRLSRAWRPWASPSQCMVKPQWHPGIEASFGSAVGRAAAALAGLQQATGEAR